MESLSLEDIYRIVGELVLQNLLLRKQLEQAAQQAKSIKAVEPPNA